MNGLTPTNETTGRRPHCGLLAGAGTKPHPAPSCNEPFKEKPIVHPVYVLAFLTLLIVAGLALWNLWSTKRQQQPGETTSGPGGPNDPLR